MFSSGRYRITHCIRFAVLSSSSDIRALLPSSVWDLAACLGLRERIVAGLQQVAAGDGAGFAESLAGIPVLAGRGVTRLGSFGAAGERRWIRLQPDQEPEQLVETFLHEVAHACVYIRGGAWRQHGEEWRTWCRAFGLDGRRTGRSERLGEIREERMKPVAVCGQCGVVFQRLRRFSRRRVYHHRGCGGKLHPL